MKQPLQPFAPVGEAFVPGVRRRLFAALTAEHELRKDQLQRTVRIVRQLGRKSQKLLGRAHFAAAQTPFHFQTGRAQLHFDRRRRPIRDWHIPPPKPMVSAEA
jgi:hypothetical protein